MSWCLFGVTRELEGIGVLLLLGGPEGAILDHQA